jgi:hypothetical protein
MHTLSCEALYARAWAEPMPTLAARLGVGASPLRQACHDAGIPMPGRGHWTRLRAGKPVVQAPLPPRGPAIAQRITLAAPGLDGVDAWRAELASPLPDPPDFDEPIEAVRARTAAQLGPITVQPHLERACAGIRRLLVADDVRRAARKARRASPDGEDPLFDSPFEQRRLRLLNSVAFGLGRVGARLDLGGRTGRELAVLVGRQRVTLTLDAPGALSVQGEWNVRPRPEGPLVLKITAKGVLELTPSS